MLRVVLLAAAFFCTQVVFHGSAASAHQESKVYICPMHPEVQSSTPGKCPKCKMSLVVQQPPAATSPEAADAYVCPMHPEIRSGSPGKCPKCAMPLVPAIPAIGDDFELIVECTPRAPVPGEKAKLRFAVFNPKTREQVKEFAVMHDKLFHVFIISQDLTQFQHIHPRLGDDGSFTVEAVLPAAGRYKVYSDFYPVDGAPQVLQTSIATAGYKSDLLTSEARLTPDATAAKIVTGSKVPQDEADKLGVVFDRLKPGGANAMKVELTIEPYELIAGRPATLKFHLTDAKSGAPVKDLLPYLSAWGHTLILSEDQSDYVHSHPEEVVPATADLKKVRGGPDVTFNAFFPRPGVYRIWTQFLRGDAIATAVFTVKARRL